MESMSTVELQSQDRVAVVRDGQIRKARVQSVTDDGLVAVTFAKGEDAVTYNRSDVFPLYRYSFIGVILFCNLPQNAKVPAHLS